MHETEIASLMLDGMKPSVLMTDAYKLPMAQAGFPLRTESFYLSFRKQGAYYIPFDIAEILRALLPTGQGVTLIEDQFLRGYESNGYDLSPAMIKALDGKVTVTCPPKGSWVYGKEPLAVVQGPGFKVSWLEPMCIWLHFPIQIATAAMKGERAFKATCKSEAFIIQLTLDACGILDATVTTHKVEYQQACEQNARELREAVGPASLFEVGMRAATCMEMHEIALQACKANGINSTSNLFLAHKLGMRPVGTTGHEHQQRWAVLAGSDLPDVAGYRAIRDMRSRSPSYLPDTVDADNMGLPAAVQIIRETPDRECFVRFDQRDKIPSQLAWLHAQVADYPVDYVFEDGIRPESAKAIRSVCDQLGIASKRQHFGSGGFLVVWGGSPFQRDAVQAVYKLTETGGVPVMKLACPEKQSIPGQPVILRRLKDPLQDTLQVEVMGIIAQEGESVPGFRRLDPYDMDQENSGFVKVPDSDLARIDVSPETDRLICQCRERALVSKVNSTTAVQTA